LITFLSFYSIGVEGYLQVLNCNYISYWYPSWFSHKTRLYWDLHHKIRFSDTDRLNFWARRFYWNTMFLRTGVFVWNFVKFVCLLLGIFNRRSRLTLTLLGIARRTSRYRPRFDLLKNFQDLTSQTLILHYFHGEVIDTSKHLLLIYRL